MAKMIAQNKKARHDYFVEETYEAGIELCGTEVKSMRARTRKFEGFVRKRHARRRVVPAWDACKPIRAGQHF